MRESLSGQTFIVFTEHDTSEDNWPSEIATSGAQELKVGSLLVGCLDGPSVLKIQGVFPTFREAKTFQENLDPEV